MNRGRRFSIAAFLLAAAAAATTVWQSSRLAVLWDLSYILENASRIAAGDIPYRDFPFPYAPLTFLGQALLIRLTGRVAWHHVAYAALACAVATALTLLLARRFVSPPVALILSTPLVLLGIYCIFPHPFYDPDACLVLLVVMTSLLWLESAERPRWMAVLAGAACVVPLFVKQNIGLAFLAAIGACAVVLFLIERRRLYIDLIVGMAAGLAGALALIAAICGLGNYYRWTITFAAQRRLPPLAQQLAIYYDSDLWWWVAVVIIGALVMRRGGWWKQIGALLVATPWVWSFVRYWITDDPVEPEINLLRLWPLMLVVSLLVAFFTMREERGLLRLMPLLLVATVHGVFLSQSTWGSTYAIWPLLVLMLALLFRVTRAPAWLAAIIAAAMLHAAWPYVEDNERLTYVKLEGEKHRSSRPELRGLSMSGEWLPEFEELVAWSDRNIPRDDGILSLPGEDLFYFTTGRRPRFPVLMFDRTINPYDARTIVAIAKQRNIRWLIVKERLQLNGTPMENRDETLRLLAPHLRPAAKLKNYDVYRLDWGGTMLDGRWPATSSASTSSASSAGSAGRSTASAPRSPG